MITWKVDIILFLIQNLSHNQNHSNLSIILLSTFLFFLSLAFIFFIVSRFDLGWKSIIWYLNSIFLRLFDLYHLRFWFLLNEKLISWKLSLLLLLVSQDEINHISQFAKHEIDLSSISDPNTISTSNDDEQKEDLDGQNGEILNNSSKKLNKGLVVERGDLDLIVELIMKDTN